MAARSPLTHTLTGAAKEQQSFKCVMISVFVSDLQEGFPNLLLPIHIKNIHKCKQ